MITTDECAQEVILAARRLALLHYHFCRTIIRHLGEPEGQALIQEAIRAYGQHCGSEVREAVEELGLPTSDENYDRVRDLPKYGWETGTVTLKNGQVRPIITSCPLAELFQSLGAEGVALGRLYCGVDQAKYQAYNRDKVFVHAKNMLDGDPYCEFWIKDRQED
jgi:hypothetical protein